MRPLALALPLLFLTAPAASAGFVGGGGWLPVAVFGGAGASVNNNVTGGSVLSNGDVTPGAFVTLDGVFAGGSLIGSPAGSGFNVINGPVVVNGNITGGGFGFGGTVTGDVSAGGSATLAGTTTGNVTAGGNVALQFATVNGNVLAGGNVSLNPFGRVNGNVTANGAIANAGTITGTATPNAGVPVNPVPYTPITLPADAFTSGGAAVGGGVLAPGSYGALTVPVFGSLTLTAGDYFFDSFTLVGSSSLNFDLSGGGVNVFVTGPVTIGNFVNVNVNGVSAFDGQLVPGPNPTVQALASRVFFETLGSVTSDSRFFGTLYAPNGNITQNGSVVGSVFAGGTVTTGAFAPVFYVGSDRLVGPPAAAVPEPASVALLAAAGLAAGCVRRRRRAATAPPGR
jgi:cytoskeletal protein CcmA (bactofilin family)